MNTLRKRIAAWLYRIGDWIDPKGGGGGPIEPR